MREVIFAGLPDYVAAQRQACIDRSVALLDELGLAYEVTTATDPFFADVYAAQAAYQQGFELKYRAARAAALPGRQAGDRLDQLSPGLLRPLLRDSGGQRAGPHRLPWVRHRTARARIHGAARSRRTRLAGVGGRLTCLRCRSCGMRVRRTCRGWLPCGWRCTSTSSRTGCACRYRPTASSPGRSRWHPPGALRRRRAGRGRGPAGRVRRRARAGAFRGTTVEEQRGCSPRSTSLDSERRTEVGRRLFAFGH